MRWGSRKEKEDVPKQSCRKRFEGNLQEEGVERRLLALFRQCSSGGVRYGFFHCRRGCGDDDAERN